MTTRSNQRVHGHFYGSTLGVSDMLGFYPDLGCVSVNLGNFAYRYWLLVNLERNLITRQ